LPQPVIEKLRSDCIVTSLAVAIEELVSNSIDAGAQNIQVWNVPAWLGANLHAQAIRLSQDNP
jgi:hypothetical protein